MEPNAAYEEAVKIIEQHPELKHFVGPRDERLVQAAEKALGLRFPPTYRRFLLEYGAGSFGGEEVYGVVNDDFENSSVPDAVWFTLTEWEDEWLPRGFVVVQSTGYGPLLCLDCSQDEVTEPPVVIYHVGFPAEHPPPEVVASSFGELLLQAVREAASQ